MEPLSQNPAVEEAPDADLAASESFLDSVVEDAASESGAPAAPAPAEERAESAAAAPEHVAHWRQRFQARQATARALQEARGNQERLQQQLQELQRQVAAGPRPPAANPDPEPTFYDPNDFDTTRKWYLWRDRESARQQQQGLVQALAPIYNHLYGQVQQAQAQQAQQAQVGAWRGEENRVRSIEGEYAAAVPGYTAVVDDALLRMAHTYASGGFPEQQAAELAVRDLHAIWLRGEQMGVHPAQFLHQLLTFGSTGAPAPQAPAASSRRVRELRAAASAPEAGSLAQTTGGPAGAPNGAARLTRSGKGATTAEEIRRAGVDPEEIFRIAFQQERAERGG